MKPRDLAITLAVPLIWVAITSFAVGDRLQGVGIDVLYRLTDAVFSPYKNLKGSPTVVVAIDEETFRNEPFDGTPKVLWTPYYADVINALLAGGAKVIGFDIVMPASVDRHVKGFDRPFMKALRKGSKTDQIVLGTVQHSNKPIAPFAGYQYAVGGAKNIRPLNVVIDGDSVVRRTPLMFAKASSGMPTQFVPSMSLELAARLMDMPLQIDSKSGSVMIGKRRIAARPDSGLLSDRNGPVIKNDMLFRFDPHLDHIPTFSLVDLVKCVENGGSDFIKRHFAGKAVILGTVLDVEDRILSSIRFMPRKDTTDHVTRCTPAPKNVHKALFSRPTIPGVYIQASAVHSLVKGDEFKEMGLWKTAAIVATIAITVAVSTMLVGPSVAVVFFVLLLLFWTTVAMLAFSGGHVVPFLQTLLAAFLTMVTLFGYRFAVADRKGRQIQEAFGHYLAPSVVDRLVKNEQMPEQGGEIRNMTVWISDLEQYSTYSEILGPTEVVNLLNTVYSAMTDRVEEHNGFVAQFVGDAVVSAFGAPIDNPDHATDAVISAIACAKAVDDLNRSVELPNDLRLRIRIGISSGPLVVGNIGSQRRLSYSLVGDDINLSSRLEGANKFYGTQILVNGDTVQHCRNDLVFRKVDAIRVKGRDTPVVIYEPFGPKEHIPAETLRNIEKFDAALNDYEARNFERALDGFNALAASDQVAKIMSERCQTYIQSPPPDDWDGVNTLISK